jgi:hypothetical protein
MAYRFNNARGGVTCDKCNLLIDEDLSYQEYKEYYNDKKDLCMMCKTEKEKKEKKGRVPER